MPQLWSPAEGRRLDLRRVRRSRCRRSAWPPGQAARTTTPPTAKKKKKKKGATVSGGVPARVQGRSPRRHWLRPSRGSSGTLRLVVIFAAIAIVAVLAVWFFVLRGPHTTGEEFVGSGTGTTQNGIATAVVARQDDGFTVKLSGSQQGQTVTVPAQGTGRTS